MASTEPPSIYPDILELNTSVSPNVTFDESDYIPYHLRLETYVVPIIFALIFIVGAVGNGTLIFIFYKNKNLRNVPNTYIMNLSVGDLLVIVVTVPFVSTVYTLESWPYGEIICRLSEFVRDISVGVSVFTLTALSADRYLAIVNPMQKHMGLGAGRVTIIVSIIIWVFSSILAIPAVAFSCIKEASSGGKTIYFCSPFPDYLGTGYPKVNVMLKFLLYYACPLIIITCFYTLMARHLMISSKNVPGETQTQQLHQIEARKKVAKMVLSFVVIFAICFFPTHLFMLWFYYYPYSFKEFNDFWQALRIIGFCLSFINSCINPIALYCVSRLFRKYYNHYLFCCLVTRQPRKGRNGHSDSTSLVNFTSTFRRTSTTVSMLNTAPV